ncbi:MAG: zinc-ribbon domain-containing protein, partial [Bacteroidaceae bacterium]|nr:zinc-ribbon domain-containing protein [Bacteroidaceae bacterium]
MKRCLNCGIEYADNVKFCCECGSALTPSKIVCPSCGAEYETQQKFCSNCGSPLAATSPAQKTMDDLKAKLLAAKKVSEMPAEHVAKSYLVYDSKGEHTFSIKIEGLDLQEGALLTSIQKDVEVTYENGGVYVGRLYEGYRHGQGKENWPNG